MMIFLDLLLKELLRKERRRKKEEIVRSDASTALPKIQKHIESNLIWNIEKKMTLLNSWIWTGSIEMSLAELEINTFKLYKHFTNTH